MMYFAVLYLDRVYSLITVDGDEIIAVDRLDDAVMIFCIEFFFDDNQITRSHVAGIATVIAANELCVPIYWQPGFLPGPGAEYAAPVVNFFAGRLQSA